MCDERTIKDSQAYRLQGQVSRRHFNALTGTAAFAALLTPPASALAVTETDVTVPTPDGMADCYMVRPSSGRHPGVIVWPDAIGLRPAFRTMGKRLAASGYAVLVVNAYYRTTPSPLVSDGATFFEDDAVRDQVMGLMNALTPESNRTDAIAFVDYLDRHKAVDTARKIGTTGYCMGGAMTVRTAAAVPERIGAGASFHGGRLVTENPDSPHLLVPSTQASFLYAISEDDDQNAPNVKTVLREAYEKASLPAEIEVYAGAMHGWCALDLPVYHYAQAERAWSRLLALFQQALG